MSKEFESHQILGAFIYFKSQENWLAQKFFPQHCDTSHESTIVPENLGYNFDLNYSSYF
jgi:hypothetical protein